MPEQIDQLVTDMTAGLGVAPPPVMEADAPVPVEPDGEVYFVGLIGGKDVGKTSLVNAIAGAHIADPTGHGEGTRSAIAYAHQSAVSEVRRRLGDIRIVTHTTDYLKRQVLLDLPDIDSKYADHVALTRRMLRHMLYPVWVQSVEKYADQRPQMLLAQVAEGNDPANFLFLLNKVDQLIDSKGLQAAGELSEDYGERLARLLGLKKPADVMLVSAIRPREYDLPMLRKRLGVQRSAKQVERSRQLADRRRHHTILHWVSQQDLPARAESSRRLLDESAGLLSERVGAPVLEDALPRLEQDAGHRLSLAEPAVRQRLRAWPILNLIDALARPVIALVRKNMSAAMSDEATLDACLTAGGRSISRDTQMVFAQLNNAYAEVAPLYAQRRLWESPEAETAAADLRARLLASLEAQRTAVAERFAPSPWLAPMRWLLTVGAAAWFILLQPLAQTLVSMTQFDWWALFVSFVQLMSASMLLTSVGFVAIYLLVLWATLRITTTWRVAAWRKRMSTAEADDPQLSPAAQVLEWMQGLLSPLERRHEQLAELSRRAADLGKSLEGPQTTAPTPATAAVAA